MGAEMHDLIARETALYKKHWAEREYQSPESEGKVNNVNALYDVVAVRLDTGAVRLIAEAKTLRDAKATVHMAVMRRGVETEFFVEVPAGSYQEGATWTGWENDTH